MTSAPVLSRDIERLTVDDWLNREDLPDYAELYQGMLILSPAPDAGHQIVVQNVSMALGLISHREGGIAFVAPTGVVFSDDVGFEPDVFYLSSDRVHYLHKRGVKGPPDIVAEIASPGTRRFDRLTKLPAYQANGVREVWLIDPETRTVEVHEPGPAEPRTCRFGEPIPSHVVDVGSAFLERVPDHLEP
jgi:Uma2 family endonuclease